MPRQPAVPFKLQPPAFTFFPLLGALPSRLSPGFACSFPMKWGIYWPEALIGTLVLAINGVRWFHPTDASNPIKSTSAWTPQRKLAARYVATLGSLYPQVHFIESSEKTRELWYHGFDNYMTFGV